MSEPGSSGGELLLVPFFDSLIRQWSELPPEERDALGVDTMRRAEALLRLPGPWSAYRLREGLRACVARTRAQDLALERAFTEAFGPFDEEELHRVHRGGRLDDLVAELLTPRPRVERTRRLRPEPEEGLWEQARWAAERVADQVRHAADQPGTRIAVLLVLLVLILVQPTSPLWNVVVGPADDDDVTTAQPDDDDVTLDDDDSTEPPDDDDTSSDDDDSGDLRRPSVGGLEAWKGRPAPLQPVLTPIPRRLFTGPVVLLFGLALACLVGAALVLLRVLRRRLPVPDVPLFEPGRSRAPLVLEPPAERETEALIEPGSLDRLADTVGLVLDPDRLADLDLRASVTETTRRAGLPTAVLKARKRLRHVVVLAWAGSRTLRERPIHRELVRGFRARGVPALLGHWDAGLQWIRMEGESHPVSLDRLHQNESGAVILLVGEVEGLLDLRAGLRLLRPFRRVAWLDPRDPAAWTGACRRVARELPLFATDRAAWDALAAWIARGESRDTPVTSVRREPPGAAWRPLSSRFVALSEREGREVQGILGPALVWTAALAACPVRFSAEYAWWLLRRLATLPEGAFARTARLGRMAIDRIRLLPHVREQARGFVLAPALRRYLWWDVLARRWPALHRRVLEAHIEALEASRPQERTQADRERRASLALLRWVLATRSFPGLEPSEERVREAATELRAWRRADGLGHWITNWLEAEGDGERGGRLIEEPGESWTGRTGALVRAATRGVEPRVWTRSAVAALAALGLGLAACLGSVVFAWTPHDELRLEIAEGYPVNDVGWVNVEGERWLGFEAWNRAWSLPVPEGRWRWEGLLLEPRVEAIITGDEALAQTRVDKGGQPQPVSDDGLFVELAEGLARVWDDEGRLVAVLASREGPITFAGFSSSGDRVVGMVQRDDAMGMARWELADRPGWLCVDELRSGGVVLRCPPDGRPVLPRPDGGREVVLEMAPELLATGIGRRAAGLLLESGSVDRIAAGRSWLLLFPREYPQYLAGRGIWLDQSGLELPPVQTPLIDDLAHSSLVRETTALETVRALVSLGPDLLAPATLPADELNPYDDTTLPLRRLPALPFAPECVDPAGQARDCVWVGWFRPGSDSLPVDGAHARGGPFSEQVIGFMRQDLLRPTHQLARGRWTFGFAPTADDGQDLAMHTVDLVPDQELEPIVLGVATADFVLSQRADGLTAWLDGQRWDGRRTSLPEGRHELKLIGGCSRHVITLEVGGERFPTGGEEPFELGPPAGSWPQLEVTLTDRWAGLKARGVEVLFDGGTTSGRRSGGWSWIPREPLPCGTARLGLRVNGRFLPARDKIYRIDPARKVELAWSLADFGRSPAVQILEPDATSGVVAIRVEDRGDGIHGLVTSVNGVETSQRLDVVRGEVEVPYDPRSQPGYRIGQANLLEVRAPNAWGYLNGEQASRLLPPSGGGTSPAHEAGIRRAWDEGDLRAALALCSGLVESPARQRLAPVRSSAETLALCSLAALGLSSPIEAREYQEAGFLADPLHVPSFDGVRASVRDSWMSRQLRLLRAQPTLAPAAFERAIAYTEQRHPLAVVLLMKAYFERPDPAQGTDPIVAALLVWALAELELGEREQALRHLEVVVRLDPGADLGPLGFLPAKRSRDLGRMLEKVRPPQPGEPEPPDRVFGYERGAR